MLTPGDEDEAERALFEGAVALRRIHQRRARHRIREGEVHGHRAVADEIALMKRVKLAFDPHGVLNPGKMFPDAWPDHAKENSRMKAIRTLLLAAVAAVAGCESIYDRDVTVVVAGPATVQVGATVLLTATLEYSSGPAEVIGPSRAGFVIWSSSDITIATVDFFGAVTGVAPGSVTITATPAPGNVDGKRTPGTHAMTVVP